MNERIRELAQKVFSFKYKSNPNELNPDHNMDHIHKFAELIVRESIVDFYRRYLDLESEEDITEQVNRYVKDNFGGEK